LPFLCSVLALPFYLKKLVLCPRSNDVDHVGEEVLNSPDRQLGTQTTVMVEFIAV
jgi:hypothetical protein